MRIALALSWVATLLRRNCGSNEKMSPQNLMKTSYSSCQNCSSLTLLCSTQQIHEILISTMFFWPFGHKIRDLLLFSMLWSALKETLSRGKQVSFKYLKYHWKCTITSQRSDHFLIFVKKKIEFSKKKKFA